MKTLSVPVVLILFAILGCAVADDGEPQRAGDRAPAGQTGDQTDSRMSMKVISRGSYGKLARDIDSGRGEAPFLEVARDQGSLTRLWNRYIAEGEQPEVSFDRSIVVFLLLPPRPTGGYGIEPKDARMAGDTLEVNAALREPDPRDIV
ncbi:MAG: hypothetical protein KY432_06695, partial [Acidobacteria bacterium]|nr:hypothetical protein [Acidobacteriota bacterium]